MLEINLNFQIENFKNKLKFPRRSENFKQEFSTNLKFPKNSIKNLQILIKIIGKIQIPNRP